MASNGQLPRSDLRRIYSPYSGGLLAKVDGCAAAWNSMNLKAWKSRKMRIYPGGPNSAYRTYAQQVLMKALYGSNAATPGTSNHGWGLAVDLATTGMRAVLDAIGESFGWAKKWSDASWEWWHIKYHPGTWHRRPNPGPSVKYPIMRRGCGGPGQGIYVQEIRKRLRNQGFPRLRKAGPFTVGVHRCVKQYQRKRGLHADGVVGPRTWKALRR